jgi:micrococcal nuclease
MRSLRVPPRPLALAVLGLLVAGGVAGCGPDAEADAADATATVGKVVDARTVEVEQGDQTLTVRLLGLDSPAPDECLVAESADALSDLLPVGTEVRLEPSEESQDVAAVYVDDVLVNAELARRGLAHVDAGAAGAIAEPLTDAEADAIDDGAGLFGADDACTVPAQVAALEQSGSQAADEAGTLAAGVGLDEVDRHAAAVAAAAATGAALAALLDGDDGARYPDTVVADLRSRTVAVNQRLGETTSAVQLVRASEEQRIEAERVAAEAAAAQAAADEAARQAQAAADAEAARVAAKAAAAKAAQKAAPPASSGGSTYYKNCDAVRAAGADPIYAGQPGYSSKLDRDGDGIACE